MGDDKVERILFSQGWKGINTTIEDRFQGKQHCMGVIAGSNEMMTFQFPRGESR